MKKLKIKYLNILSLEFVSNPTHFDLSIVNMFGHMSVSENPLNLWMTSILFFEPFAVIDGCFFTRFQL